MSYQCLGGANYRFTLVLYRDCYGGGSAFDSDFNSGAPFAGTVTVYSGNSTVPAQIIELAQPVVANVQPPFACGFPTTCIERGTYVFDASLPTANEPVHVVYQRCCRNASISNITLTGETGATWAITITPQANAVCNSSPIFGLMPMICSVPGEPFTFDHSATDADDDVLTYEFCAPLQGGGNDQINSTAPNGVAPDPDMPPPYDPVSFVDPPYSAAQPIPGAPAFTIDPSTGLVSGMPNIQGRFLYAVCVNEFRNGQLLSVTRYEFGHDVGLVSGTDDISHGHLKVYPNPTASGGFTVELPQMTSALHFEAQLFNMSGLLMASRHAVDGRNLVFTSPDLLPGVYQLLLRNGQEAYHERIVVQASSH